MSIYKNILDDMTWSYSRLTAYEHCPYSWYRRYIEGEAGEGSFYADNGKAMHRVFDELVMDKLKIEDAPSRYLELFEQIENTTKQEIMDKTFDTCINYLCELDPSILDNYETASEVYINWYIDKHLFQGYIDLLMDEVKDDSVTTILVDHKSSPPFLKKDGTPKASTKEQFIGYKRQMYLYAEAIYQNFGVYPKKLVFHHFKDGGKLTVIDFNEKEKDEAIEWARGVIKKIYEDEEFLPKTKTGFCFRLCDYRRDCDYIREDEDE